jgi:RNA polymerase sigma-70 factor, ECF subfamily
MSERGSVCVNGDMGPDVARSERNPDSNECAPLVVVVEPRGLGASQASTASAPRLSANDSERLRRALNDHFGLVWRTVRRFGVEQASADDAAQQVFLTFLNRLPEVLPGAERAFLVASCVRVAANLRRLRQRRAEVSEDGDLVDHEGQTPEQLLEWKRLRQQLDRALSALTSEQRHVFVLHELEGFSLPEIAASLGVPVGTATSRLRRARLGFELAVSAISVEGGVAP